MRSHSITTITYFEPMNDFYIGLATTIVVIVLMELLRNSDRRLIGALTLSGIAFIYIGFCWKDVPSLVAAIFGVGVFFALSYLGYKWNFLVIIIGLLLHGAWDIVFPLFSSAAPEGYGIFCLTIDILLAIYYYLRIRPVKSF
jgi:hypothetical protein